MDEATMRAAANDVGHEPSGRTSSQTENIALTVAMEQFGNWWWGLVISFLPLLAVPLYKAFNNDISVGDFFFKLFSNCEWIFIGVSLAITSLNDYIQYSTKKKKKSKISFNIVLIVAGAIVYGLMTICNQTPESFNDLLALGFNIIFMLMILIVGSGEYIQQIMEVK